MARLPALLVCTILLGSHGHSQQPAKYHTDTLDVGISAIVLAGNVPVGGLTVEDFELTDNGVPQDLRDLEIEGLPVDVSFVIDTSGSTERVLNDLRRDTQVIIRGLARTDRFRLVTVGTYVHEVLAMRFADPSTATTAEIAPGGNSAVYDALAATLMSRTELGRRHLVVAMTDGRDTMSTLNVEQVLNIAARSETVVHILLVGSAPSSLPRVFPWLPYHELNEDALRQAAAMTGGRLHDLRPQLSGVRAVQNVIKEFRQCYVLRYAPTNVELGGWHEVAVKVRRSGKYTVRARKGYFGVEPPPK